MSSRVVARKLDLGTEEMSKMYKQMLGIEEGDTRVCLEKYVNLTKHIKVYMRLLELLSDPGGNLIKLFPETGIEFHMRQIREEVARLRSSYPYVEDGDIPETVVKKYITSKTLPELKTAVVLGNNLNRYKKHLESEKPEERSSIFIKRHLESMPMRLFPFSDLDLKRLYMTEGMRANTASSKNVDEYILAILHKLLTVCVKIYNVLSSPDINVADFGKVLIKSLMEVKKMIPRCDAAFKIIEQSIGMFENNFNGYYKNFVTSQNPNVLLEDFLRDVSEQQPDGNVKVKSQFARIMAFIYKMKMKMSGGAKSDIDSVYMKVQTALGMMDSDDGMVETNADQNQAESDIGDTPEVTDAITNDFNEKLGGFMVELEQSKINVNLSEASANSDTSPGAGAGDESSTA